MFLGKIYKSKECEIKVSDMAGAPETDATIKIRLLTPGERKGLLMSSFKTTYSADDSGSMKPEMLSEHYKMNEHLFMKAVVGWEGFYEDEEGTVPLKFGQAGKIKLLSVVPDLADYVTECHGKMVEEEEANKEASIKNSLPGSKDSGTQEGQTVKSAKK
jgi:hypothetical protein